MWLLAVIANEHGNNFWPIHMQEGTRGAKMFHLCWDGPTVGSDDIHTGSGYGHAQDPCPAACQGIVHQYVELAVQRETNIIN